jgi:hypothetical protein
VYHPPVESKQSPCSLGILSIGSTGWHLTGVKEYRAMQDVFRIFPRSVLPWRFNQRFYKKQDFLFFCAIDKLLLTDRLSDVTVIVKRDAEGGVRV